MSSDFFGGGVPFVLLFLVPSPAGGGGGFHCITAASTASYIGASDSDSLLRLRLDVVVSMASAVTEGSAV